MAKNKPVNAEQLDADLTTVANAIRAKSGSTEPMEWPAGFVSAINAIETNVLDENARAYYIGTAESVLNADSVNVQTSAVGLLT